MFKKAKNKKTGSRKGFMYAPGMIDDSEDEEEEEEMRKRNEQKKKENRLIKEFLDTYKLDREIIERVVHDKKKRKKSITTKNMKLKKLQKNLKHSNKNIKMKTTA